MKARYEDDIMALTNKVSSGDGNEATTLKGLLQGISIIENLGKYYQQGTLEQKQQIIGSTFPRMMEFSNGKVRTR